MSIDDKDAEAIRAAETFGLAGAKPEVISEGLIHRTFRAVTGNFSLLLQQINTQVFPYPEKIISNYLHINNHLKSKEIFLPEAIPASGNHYLYFEGKNVWRAFTYVPDAYSPSAEDLTPELAFRAAACFAKYTAALSDLNINLIQPALPDFHNLQWRYLQFEEAYERDAFCRKENLDYLNSRLRQRKFYVAFYQSFAGNRNFPVRIMHCDCKISNLLFDRNTAQAICPVDWDTVMPGWYFSDLGDLIRSTVSAVPESGTDFLSLHIRKEIYEALTEGYLSHASCYLTPQEKNYLHHAGLLMTYMQALRFATDYLNGDVYYKTTHPEQNLHRAMNQLSLLEKLESFLLTELNYRIVS